MDLDQLLARSLQVRDDVFWPLLQINLDPLNGVDNSSVIDTCLTSIGLDSMWPAIDQSWQLQQQLFLNG
jgi:hypothetical protein